MAVVAKSRTSSDSFSSCLLNQAGLDTTLTDTHPCASESSALFSPSFLRSIHSVNSCILTLPSDVYSESHAVKLQGCSQFQIFFTTLIFISWRWERRKDQKNKNTLSNRFLTFSKIHKEHSFAQKTLKKLICTANC